MVYKFAPGELDYEKLRRPKSAERSSTFTGFHCSGVGRAFPRLILTGDALTKGWPYARRRPSAVQKPRTPYPWCEALQEYM